MRMKWLITRARDEEGCTTGSCVLVMSVLGKGDQRRTSDDRLSQTFYLEMRIEKDSCNGGNALKCGESLEKL
jgi:hypothetical protein